MKFKEVSTNWLILTSFWDNTDTTIKLMDSMSFLLSFDFYIIYLEAFRKINMDTKLLLNILLRLSFNLHLIITNCFRKKCKLQFENLKEKERECCLDKQWLYADLCFAWTKVWVEFLVISSVIKILLRQLLFPKRWLYYGMWDW